MLCINRDRARRRQRKPVRDIIRGPARAEQLRVDEAAPLMYSVDDLRPLLRLLVVPETWGVAQAAGEEGDLGGFGEEQRARDHGALGVVGLCERARDVGGERA